MSLVEWIHSAGADRIMLVESFLGIYPAVNRPSGKAEESSPLFGFLPCACG
jgi:hypothetical protein